MYREQTTSANIVCLLLNGTSAQFTLLVQMRMQRRNELIRESGVEIGVGGNKLNEGDTDSTCTATFLNIKCKLFL